MREGFWKALGGVQFENEVADLLRQLGHDVQTTPHSGDEGVDLILDRETIIQCKAHSKPVSPGTVRELLGAKAYFKAGKAILISTNGCTSGAKDFAEKTGIELWDTTHLIALQDGIG
jgi:restriction system protein